MAKIKKGKQYRNAKRTQHQQSYKLRQQMRTCGYEQYFFLKKVEKLLPGHS